MDDLLERYVATHIDKEGELLQALNRDTHVNMLRPRMLSGHLQGRILKMLCRMIHPGRVLELGTYTGYSALCFAEALDDTAQIDTIEIDDELQDISQRYFDASPVGKKIHPLLGDALQIIPHLPLESYDLVFIDADKRCYLDYYHLLMKGLRPGSFILADNTLWDGKVIERLHPSDAQTAGIIAFNDFIATDPRVEKVILPLRDGLTLIHVN